MSDHPFDNVDAVEFDETVALALAQAAGSTDAPRAEVKERLMARVAESMVPVPQGFSLRFDRDGGWLPHPVPGIRMRVLSIDRDRDFATLVFDVAPGTHFPHHHHTHAEECYVLSGSLYTCGRRFGPGDFVHADAGTDHDELWTDEGCRVLLVVEPEDYMPEVAR